MPTVRIGLCEDDPTLRSVLRRALVSEGYDVRETLAGSQAVQVFSDDPPDLLVLDIGLPDADGRDVCQALRSHGVRSPVLFLTARDAVADRLAGFHAGGDDYLTKPFALAELVVRIGALLRRSGSVGTTVALGGELRLDPVRHGLSGGERDVMLTPTEYRLLAALVGRPQEVLRRRELIAAAWPDGAIVHANTLDSYIGRLRRKLAELRDAPSIATVRGIGYRLD